MATKREMKKAQQFEEQIRRTMNVTSGLTREQAIIKIQKEDYAALPLEQKFKRMENVVSGFFRQIAGDVNTLRHNDGIIADSSDINMRALSKMFEKLGIGKEEQAQFVKTAQEEYHSEIAANIKAREDAQELENVGQTIQNALETQDDTDSDDVPEAPEGATVFGG